VKPDLDYSPYLNWTADAHVVAYGSFKPKTSYTVSLPAGTRDQFGRGLVTPLQLEFTMPESVNSPTAPAVTPSAWIIGPGRFGTYNAYSESHTLVTTTNVSHLDFTVERLAETVALEALGSK